MTSMLCINKKMTVRQIQSLNSSLLLKAEVLFLCRPVTILSGLSHVLFIHSPRGVESAAIRRRLEISRIILAESL